MPPNNSIFYIIKHHSTVHTKQCLYIIPYFHVFCKRVTHIFLKNFIAVELGAFLHWLTGAYELPQAGSALTGRLLFLHRLSGVLELRQRVRPNGAAPFSAPESRGARTALACSPLTGRLLFLHRPSGALELRQRVRPDGAASFPAPADRGARTASAGSPFPGGEFFAEPQRGDSPSADGGSVPRPAAGAKRKDNLRFSFLFELLPFPCLLARRRFPICDRFEK